MKNIIAFLIKLLVIYFIWVLIEEILPRVWADFDVMMMHFRQSILINLKNSTVFLFENTLDVPIQTNFNTIYFGEQGSLGYLYISRPCLGYDLMAMFAGFIIAYPGKWKVKLWFIPMGIVIIHILNIIRSYSVGITLLKNPALLDFNHHILFKVIVYAFTFAMWIWFIRKYSTLGTVKETKKLKEENPEKS